MLPSSTVENYLKAIYLGVARLAPSQRLMPMGQLAAALGVAPGTATTMVKTLAESGLVEYEPYAGVALTGAGEKLAALVLRRHRLIELFLVRVMGYAWDEVHDEAEQLEHAVTDRLIDRMDDMLGRPEVDPHGDPIPTADGHVKREHADTLLTCPLHTPVTVLRVMDQDKAFLRFIEHHRLKPGESIEVEHRDAASDSVRVRGRQDQPITIGMRAASKLLVRAAGALLLLIASAANAYAQSSARASTPFEIIDNSMLVEEAFNQDAGVFQNIVTFERDGRRRWQAAVTQEWPLGGVRHQASYTIPFAADGADGHVGNVALHYRLQATRERGRVPAIAPRVSVILPTADGAPEQYGGWQMNLPVSKQFGDLYLHGNAGVTRQHRLSTQAAASVVWRVRRMVHLLAETTSDWPRAHQAVQVTLAPGVRIGWNRARTQTVLGVGVPTTFARGTRADLGVIAYLSHELPFD